VVVVVVVDGLVAVRVFAWPVVLASVVVFVCPPPCAAVVFVVVVVFGVLGL